MKKSKFSYILISLTLIIISVSISACKITKSPPTPSINNINETESDASLKNAILYSKSIEKLRSEEEAKKLEEQKKAEEQQKVEAQKKLEEQQKQQSKAVQASNSNTSANPSNKAQTSSPAAPNQPTAAITNTETRLIDRIKAKGSSQQVILVQAPSYGTYKVVVSAYEKINGSWNEFLTNVPGVIGRRGFSKNRREGDYTSPVGAFHFPYIFGWGGNAGFKMPYKFSTNDDYWISLENPEYYNVWFHKEGGADPAWTKDQYEILGPAQKLYKFAAVMDFNMGANKIVGKGSGIFLHILPTSGLGTAGCTAIPEDKLLKVLRWLDPSKNPVIIQGTLADLDSM